MGPRRERIRSRLAALERQWDAVQVELHGDYSIDHIKAFHAYVARTPWWRALFVCVTTPVPSAVMVLLTELLSLEDPATHTARTSPNVWIRFFLLTSVGSTCVLEQFRQHAPSLELSRNTIGAIVVPSAAVTTLCAYLLSSTIAYPMPFGANLVMVPWVCTLVGLLLLSIRRQVREKPQLPVELKRFRIVWVCQFAMAMVYPLYNAVFVRLSTWKQAAFAFILPCIKVTAKNIISRSLASTEVRSEGVVFNVEVFHALFVSFSMQGATGMHTIVVFMAIDFAQGWLALRDISAIRRGLDPVLSRHPGSTGHILSLAHEIAKCEPFHGRASNSNILQSQIDSWRALARTAFCCGSRKVQNAAENSTTVKTTSNWLRSGSSAASIVPDPNPPLRPAASDSLPPQARSLSLRERGRLVRRAQKLLFVTEFIALVEFTEVMIPCLFNMYLLIMFHLSNRPYYGFLANLTVETLGSQVATISLYALFELASLVIIATILWRQLGLSLLHQIAFVLEERQASIQTKVMMWSIVVMQYGVRQLGVDYSFRFAWLDHRTP